MSCLHHLYKENIQDFLENNLGRQLTPLELNRMKCALIENEDINHLKMDIIHLAGMDAIENQGNRWEHVDADFIKKNDSFSHLNCKEL